MMGILDQHHRVLQKLNTTEQKMTDKIFDYVIYLSSDDHPKPEPSIWYKENYLNQSSVN